MSVGNKEKMSYTLCPLEGDNVRRALEVLFESSIHYQKFIQEHKTRN